MGKIALVLFFCLIALHLCSDLTYADNKELDSRIDECEDLVEEIMQMPEKSIPAD